MQNNIFDAHTKEQAETAIDNLAGAIATYYKSLIEHGLPIDFVESLTIEYQACFLEMIQRQNEQQSNRD